jgi:ADP-ribosylglycohydrolase
MSDPNANPEERRGASSGDCFPNKVALSQMLERDMAIGLRDRVRGVLVGLAAGDRIGGPLCMALCLAESLAEGREFSRKDILNRYLVWWREGGFDTGFVSGRVFDLITSGVIDREVVARTHAESGGRTAGCNPAHRSPPLAMAAFLADDRLPDLARQEAILTHRDPLAGDVAAAVVALCRSLIKGADWPAALAQAAIDREERIRDALLGGSNAPLHDGGFAPEVLRAAVFFLSAHTGFAAALEASVAFAGPSNYCPVLVGAIAGARWGAGAVPSELLMHCEILDRVQTTASALAGSW